MKLNSLCSHWICALNEHAFIDEPQLLLDLWQMMESTDGVIMKSNSLSWYIGDPKSTLKILDSKLLLNFAV